MRLMRRYEGYELTSGELKRCGKVWVVPLRSSYECLAMKLHDPKNSHRSSRSGGSMSTLKSHDPESQKYCWKSVSSFFSVARCIQSSHHSSTKLTRMYSLLNICKKVVCSWRYQLNQTFCSTVNSKGTYLSSHVNSCALVDENIKKVIPSAIHTER